MTGQTAHVAITVGIVEDEAFARVALAASLRAHGFHVLFDTDSAPRAMDLFPLRRPAVGIIDIHLGDGPSGIDLAVRLRAELPTVGLVFLTSFDEPRLLGRTLPPLPPGSIYLTKASITSMRTVGDAIRDAAAWRRDPRRRNSAATPGPTPALQALTDSQVETLRLVAAGLTNAEIARRRGVREKAVESTIGRIAKRLGVEPDAARNQRVHLARVYLRTLGAKDADDTPPA